ncbi:MAG TPA: tetratricopeptide repeat protein [Candidatus Obscuribacterales bacterium]
MTNGYKLLGLMMATALWLPAAGVLVPERATAQTKQTAITPQTFPGRLDQNSPVLSSDGSYYHDHTFEGEAGQIVLINLESSEFDAYLLLLGVDGAVLAQNDDFVGTNSQVLIALPTTGTYTIRVTSYASGEIGSYTLGVRSASAAEIVTAETRLAVAERLAEADRIFQQGAQQFQANQFEAALQSWQQALELCRDPAVQAAFPQESRQREGGLLNILGSISADLAQYEQAIDFYTQALVVNRAIGDRQTEGNVLIGLGNAYRTLAQYGQAIDFYQQALQLARATGNRQREGEALGSLGVAHKLLGQDEQAIGFYEQALAIFRETGDRRQEGITLNDLGTLAQPEQAIDFYQEALQLAREIGDQLVESNALSGLGNAYLSLGQHARAVDFYEQNLAMAREIGDRQGEGIALGNLGVAYRNLGQYQQALEGYQQALAMAQAIGARDNEGVWLSNIGALIAQQDQPELAIIFYKQSVNVREAIRGDLASLSPDLQQSYTETIADDYRALADLLLQQNRILEAQRVLDL